MHSPTNNIPTLVSEDDMNSFPNLEASLFNFPYSPQIHHSGYEAVYLNFNDVFYPEHPSNTEDTTTTAADQSTTTSNVDSKGEFENAVATKEKRCSKKDRHSKIINTIRGPRDCRMRLSLEVARKFFSLQDLLGFNKPSKTVDWLLKSSRTAITELERSRGINQLLKSNVSSNSESCDNLSGSCANASSSITVDHEKGLELETTLLMSAKKKTVGRDSRLKARARARERTSQKKRLSENQQKQCVVTNSLLSAAAAGERNPSMVFNQDAGLIIPNPVSLGLGLFCCPSLSFFCNTFSTLC